MDLSSTITAAAAALGDLDVAPFLARIESIDVSIGEVDTALVAAASRVRDLEAEADRLDAAGPNRHTAAEALLKGEAVPPGPTVMRDEARTVRAGVAGLRQRRGDLLEQRKSVLRELEAAVAQGLEPIAEGLATAIAQALAEVAGLIAVTGDVANAANSQLLAETLRRVHDIRGAMREGRFFAEERPEFDASPVLELARRLRAVPPAPSERPPEAAELRAASSYPAGPIRTTTLG